MKSIRLYLSRSLALTSPLHLALSLYLPPPLSPKHANVSLSLPLSLPALPASSLLSPTLLTIGTHGCIILP